MELHSATLHSQVRSGQVRSVEEGERLTFTRVGYRGDRPELAVLTGCIHGGVEGA